MPIDPFSEDAEVRMGEEAFQNGIFARSEISDTAQTSYQHDLASSIQIFHNDLLHLIDNDTNSEAERHFLDLVKTELIFLLSLLCPRVFRKAQPQAD